MGAFDHFNFNSSEKKQDGGEVQEVVMSANDVDVAEGFAWENKDDLHRRLYVY